MEMYDRKRELALFNLAIDSKLRGCDLVQLRVRDVAHGERIVTRAIVMQQKTQRPLQFEITEPTRKSVYAWIRLAAPKSRGLFIPKSAAVLPPFVDTAIRENCRNLGLRNRPGRRRLWDPHDAPHKGIADLPADEKLARRATAVRPFQN
jgi:integrase